LGSTGTNQSAGLTGITTGTYASSGTALNTIVNAGLISYKNLVWQGTSTIKWTEFPEPEPLPVEKATEPIRAWRCASRVEVIDGLVVFTGLTGPKYAAEDRAVCHAARGGEHHWTQIPVQSCTCGFYGMKPGVFLRDELKGMYPVWLEVEFYGRVLEATLGYRAQHQRVLNVYMSDYDWKELPGFRVEYTGTALKKCKQQAKDRK
jgi:hypothetical protein